MSGQNKNDLKAFFLQEFQQLEASLNGEKNSSWHQIRRKAMAEFDRIGLPGLKDEEYKYTPLARQLERLALVPSSPADGGQDTEIEDHGINLDGIRLVFLNGLLQPQRSTLPQDPDQVAIVDLQEAMLKFPEIFNQHFGQYASAEEDPYAALNTGLSTKGCFIHVAPGAAIEKPISLHFVNQSGRGDRYNQPRTLIVAEANSRVQFIESSETLGPGRGFTNSVTEVVIKPDARVEYYMVQDDPHSFHVGLTQVSQADRSYFEGHTVTLNGRMIRNNLKLDLNGEHCEAHMYGLYLTREDQHVDNHTSVDHKLPNSYSNELYKGIVDDQSNAVFNGKIFVRPGAQKTNAYQSNGNILLSEDATVNTKPQLEIWADDVQCSHGATTGQLDKEQLFYLRSRGLSKESAQAMLLNAFAGEVVATIKIPELKHYVDQKVNQRLLREQMV